MFGIVSSSANAKASRAAAKARAAEFRALLLRLDGIDIKLDSIVRQLDDIQEDLKNIPRRVLSEERTVRALENAQVAFDYSSIIVDSALTDTPIDLINLNLIASSLFEVERDLIYFRSEVDNGHLEHILTVSLLQEAKLVILHALALREMEKVQERSVADSNWGISLEECKEGVDVDSFFAALNMATPDCEGYIDEEDQFKDPAAYNQVVAFSDEQAEFWSALIAPDAKITTWLNDNLLKRIPAGEKYGGVFDLVELLADIETGIENRTLGYDDACVVEYIYSPVLFFDFPKDIHNGVEEAKRERILVGGAIYNGPVRVTRSYDHSSYTAVESIVLDDLTPDFFMTNAGNALFDFDQSGVSGIIDANKRFFSVTPEAKRDMFKENGPEKFLEQHCKYEKIFTADFDIYPSTWDWLVKGVAQRNNYTFPWTSIWFVSGRSEREIEAARSQSFGVFFGENFEQTDVSNFSRNDIREFDRLLETREYVISYWSAAYAHGAALSHSQKFSSNAK